MSQRRKIAAAAVEPTPGAWRVQHAEADGGCGGIASNAGCEAPGRTQAQRVPPKSVGAAGEESGTVNELPVRWVGSTARGMAVDITLEHP